MLKTVRVHLEELPARQLAQVQQRRMRGGHAVDMSVHQYLVIEAVKRVALVAERNTPVRLAFSEGEVVLEAGSGDDAQASEALPASLDGEDIAIAFNPTFLLDGLNALETTSARLHFTTTTKPAVLTGARRNVSLHDAEYRYLIMPVRLSG